MNKIFKTVWSNLHRCLVVVNETKSSRGKDASAGESSAVAIEPQEVGSKRLNVLSFCVGAAVVAMTSVSASQAIAAELTEDNRPSIEYSAWKGTGANFSFSSDTNQEGATFGPILQWTKDKDWSGQSFGTTSMTITNGATWTGGVYGYEAADEDDDFFLGGFQTGTLGSEGRYRIYSVVVDDGAIVENSTYTYKNDNGDMVTAQQAGGVYWIDKLAVTAKGTVKVMEIRVADTLLNESANFSVSNLLIKNGATVVNTGSIVAGSFYGAVTNDTVFNNNTYDIWQGSGAVALANGSDGTLRNAGSMTVADAFYAANIENEQGASITVTGSGIIASGSVNNEGSISANGDSSFGDTKNAGSISVTGALAANSLNQTAADAKTVATGAVSVTEDLTVKGTLQSGGKLTVGGNTNNEGAISATEADLQKLVNSGSVTLSGTNASSFGEVSNVGSISAGGNVTTGSVTQTGADASFDVAGSLTVDGNLSNAQGSIGKTASPTSVSVTGTTDITGGSLKAGYADLKGAVTNTNGTITLTDANNANSFGATTNQDGSISVGSSITFESLANKSVNNVAAVTAKDGITVTGALTNEKGTVSASGDKAVISVGTTLENSGSVSAYEIDVTNGVTNTGTLIANGGALSVGGDFIQNDENAKTEAGELTVGGQLSNSGSIGATVSPSKIIVAGAASNSGSIKGGYMTSASLNNSGSIQLTDSANKNVFGNTVNVGSINAASGIDMGSLTQKDENAELVSGGDVKVDGLLDNDGTLRATGSLTATGVTTNAGAIYAATATLGQVNNSGRITLASSQDNKTAASFGATSNVGTITSDVSLTLASLSQTSANASISTDGSLTVNGDVENQGKIESADDLTIAGGTTNLGSITTGGNASLAALTQSSADASFEADGTVKVDGKLVNAGSLDAGSDLTVTAGTENSGSITSGGNASLVSLTQTGASSSFEADGDVTLTDVLTNEGSLTAGGNLSVGKATTNSGKISAGGNATLAALTQTGADSSFDAVGSMTVNGALVNEGSIGATNAPTSLTVTSTTNNSGNITAGVLAMGDLTNSGVITSTGAAKSVFGAVSNSKTITLGGAADLASLNNTSADSSLTAKGDVTVTGAVSNLGTVSTTGALSANGITNSGVIHADASITDAGALTQNAGASLTTGGSLTVAGNASIEGTVSAAEKIALNGATNTINATVEAKNVELNGATSVKGTLAASAGLDVKTGTTTINATVETPKIAIAANAGLVIEDVSDLSSTDVTIGTGAKLENSDTLTLASIKNESGSTASGITYTQNTGTFATADNSFFENSAINIKGGMLNRLADGANTLGSGNTVTIGNSAVVRYTDQTQVNNEKFTLDEVNSEKLDSWLEGQAKWYKDQVIVQVGELNSDSTVTVNAGGVLSASEINLTDKTLTLNGGAIASNLANFFDVNAEPAYKITDHSSVVVDSEELGALDIEGLKDSFFNNLTLGDEGGTLVVTDKAVSLKSVATASSLFKEFAGDLSSWVSVVFTGIASAGSADGTNTFYYDTFASLKKEQQSLDYSVFLNPGVVFAEMSFENKQNMSDTDGKAKLVIGNAGVDSDTFYLDQSIGFASLIGTTAVSVKDGMNLTLAGLADGGEIVGGSLGTIDVSGAGSTLRLGVASLNKSGHIGTVSLGEGTKFDNGTGSFSITNLKAAGADMTIGQGSKLELLNFIDNAASTLVNNGTLHILGSIDEFNSKLTNAGELIVATATAIKNSFMNSAGAKAVFGDGFSIASTLVSDYAKNYGRIESYGDNEIAGRLRLYSGASLYSAGATNLTGMIASLGNIYSQSINMGAGSQIQMGANTLLKTDALVMDSTAKLDLFSGATLAVKDASGLLGTIKRAAGSSLVIGKTAVLNFERDEDNADVLSALTAVTSIPDSTMGTAKRTAYRATSSGIMMAALEDDEDVVYLGENPDLNKTEGFNQTTIGGEITGKDMTSGDTDNPTWALGLNTSIASGASLKGYDTAYLTQGDTLTVNEGGKFSVSNTDVNDGYYEYGNLILQDSSTTNDYGTMTVDNILALGNGAVLNADGESASVTAGAVKNAAGTITATQGATFTTTEYQGSSNSLFTAKEGATANMDVIKLAGNSALSVVGASVVAEDLYISGDSSVNLEDTGSLKTSNLSALDANGGKISVSGGSTVYATETADLNNIDIAVTDGVVGLGVDDSALSGYSSDAKAVLVLDASKSVKVGNGSLQVGTTAHDVDSGNVFFGSDSALVVTTSSDTVNTTGALVGNGSGTLTVEKGSQLVVKTSSWGLHTLVSGLTAQLDEGAWQGDDLVNATGADELGLSLSLADNGSLILGVGATADDDSEDDVIQLPSEGAGNGNSGSEGGDSNGEVNGDADNGNNSDSDSNGSESEGNGSDNAGSDNAGSEGNGSDNAGSEGNGSNGSDNAGSDNAGSEGGSNGSEGAEGSEGSNGSNGSNGSDSASKPSTVDTSIQALSSDFAAPELINGLINTVEGAALRDVNSEHADIMFIDRLLDSAYTGTGAKGVDTNRATMVWNSVAGITAVSGINAYAIENQNNVADRVEDHALTDAHARMDRSLWVDLVAGKSQTDRFQTTMPNKTGYKADSYGLILGADIANSADTVAGIALSYVKGDLKSKGSYLKTDSDAKAWGANLYGSQKFGNAKVSGLFGFQAQNGKASQSYTDLLGNGYGISNRQDSKSIVLSVKAEYDFPVSKSLSVKPHAGMRYSYTHFDDSVIKINGKSAFNVDTDSKNLLKVPVGVAIEGNFKANSWNVSPKADLSVVPQFGKTSVSSKVSARSFKGSDSFTYDVTGKVAGELVLGVEAQSKAHSVGVYYKGSIGDKGRTSNSVNVGYRFSF